MQEPYLDLICDSEGSIFNALKLDERDLFRRFAKIRKHEKASIVVIEGMPAWGILYVQAGKAKVFKLDKQGSEHIIRLVQPGDIIGMKAVIAASPYVNHASALEELHVVFVPQEVIWEFLQKNFTFCKAVLKLLAGELSLIENQFAQMARLTVKERLAETLLVLCEKFGLKIDNQTLNVGLRREDISYIVGADYASTLRALSELRHENLISTKGRNIKILDRTRLEQISRVK